MVLVSDPVSKSLDKVMVPVPSLIVVSIAVLNSLNVDTAIVVLVASTLTMKDPLTSVPL